MTRDLDDCSLTWLRCTILLTVISIVIIPTSTVEFAQKTIFGCTGCLTLMDLRENQQQKSRYSIGQNVIKYLANNGHFLAQNIVKYYGVRSKDDGLIKDFHDFESKCKKPFSMDEAKQVAREFEAHMQILTALQWFIEDNERKPSGDLRQLHAAVNCHSMIARSLEILPKPLVQYPTTRLIAFAVAAWLLIAVISWRGYVAVHALYQQEPDRFFDGYQYALTVWSNCTNWVLQTARDNNKVSASVWAPSSPDIVVDTNPSEMRNTNLY
uniref:Uncharacterized protein n=1 Tax=Spongospora subterranea TaxID=70186 RepID=A0A0H5R954_9EUKA|eukprot:CRZ10281.1 hypothetical protein [Spongospora subterranea]